MSSDGDKDKKSAARPKGPRPMARPMARPKPKPQPSSSSSSSTTNPQETKQHASRGRGRGSRGRGRGGGGARREMPAIDQSLMPEYQADHKDINLEPVRATNRVIKSDRKDVEKIAELTGFQPPSKDAVYDDDDDDGERKSKKWENRGGPGGSGPGGSRPGYGGGGFGDGGGGGGGVGGYHHSDDGISVGEGEIDDKDNEETDDKLDWKEYMESVPNAMRQDYCIPTQVPFIPPRYQRVSENVVATRFQPGDPSTWCYYETTAMGDQKRAEIEKDFHDHGHTVLFQLPTLMSIKTDDKDEQQPKEEQDDEHPIGGRGKVKQEQNSDAESDKMKLDDVEPDNYVDQVAKISKINHHPPSYHLKQIRDEENPFKDVQSGKIGNLLIYKSGRAVLELGNIKYDVTSGFNCSATEETWIVKPDGNDPKGKQHLYPASVNAGRVIVTPDFTTLLAQTEEK